MKKIFVGLFLFSALGGEMPAVAQGTSAAPRPGLADQLDSCHQNVVQLTEQSRGHRTKLASLRMERKTIGVSQGEMVRYKLATLDQEIRERSRQNQSIVAQIDSENKRCELLAAKAAAGNRGMQTPDRKP